MKKFALILVVLVSFLSMSFTSQETIWLDKDLKQTSQSKAEFYKIGHKLQGEVVYYYVNRTAYRKVFYSDGKLNGKFSEFYATGELSESGKYVQGSRDGNWKSYYKNGKIKSRGRYKNGEKVGIWKFFYKNI